MLTKIKTVFNGDIRRFDLRDVSFASFDQMVRSTYGFGESTLLTFCYLDDEKDLCHISSDDELEDALQVAEADGRKSLRVSVSSDETFDPDPAALYDDSSSVAPSVNVEPLYTFDEDAKDASPEPDVSAEAPPSKEEVLELCNDLFGSENIRSDIVPAVQAALTAIAEGESDTSVIDTFLATSDEILNHRSVQRLVPFLPLVMPHLSQRLELLRRNPPLLAWAQMLVPTVLPGVVQMLPQILEKLIDREPEAIFGGLQQQLMAQVFQGAPMNPGAFEPRQPPSTPAAPAETAETAETKDEAVHDGVECDQCGVHPIKGDRFKCAVCPNYDLCSGCNASGRHPQEHPMILFHEPAHKRTIRHHGIICDGCGANPIEGDRYKCTVCHDYDLCSACESRHTHPRDHPLIMYREPVRRAYCPPFRRGHHHDHNQSAEHQIAELFNRCARGAKRGCGSRSRSSSQNWRRGRTARPQVSFLKNVTLDDRVSVLPNQNLIKVWQVRNSGTERWPEGTKLIFLRGDRQISAEEEFAVTRADAGEVIEISAEIISPSKPGRYTAYFRLANQDRDMFGPRLWVDIVVAESASAPVMPDKPDTEPAPAEPVIAQQYAMQLQILSSMGFADEGTVLRHLVANRGDIKSTYAALIKELQ